MFAIRGTVRTFSLFRANVQVLLFYPNEGRQCADQQFPIFSLPLHTSDIAWQNLFYHRGSVDLADSILSLFRQQKDAVLSAYYVFLWNGADCLTQKNIFRIFILQVFEKAI